MYDVNVNRAIHVIPDVHTKPVHTIEQNSGSAFVSHPPEGYDIFLTAALGDGAKLRDVRSGKCVRHFIGHVSEFQSFWMVASRYNGSIERVTLSISTSVIVSIPLG